MSWEAFVVSSTAVTLGEIGDKTQLLALLLVARYRRPGPIAAGILVATLANHALAAALGTAVAQFLTPNVLRWLLGTSFVAVGLWMLKPDSANDPVDAGPPLLGLFGLTVAAFFLAEMGDKTQVATVMLGAKYPDPIVVTLGTTLGMMVANLPVVMFGDRLMRRLPVAWLQRCAAMIFMLLGSAVLLGFANPG